MHSQHNEDLLIKKILDMANEEKGHYIDVGCNHPVYANNTYLLYNSGWRGICIDAHDFSKEFATDRPDDQFLNFAIANAEGTADFNFKEGLEGLSGLLESDINTEKKQVTLMPLAKIVEQRNIA